MRPRRLLSILSGVAACAPLLAAPALAQVRAVGPIAITVGDADAVIPFYRDVLDFQVEGETEIAGDAAENVLGVFGTRARVVHLRLGNERLDLVDFLAPEGRPLPADARSNDHAFQHVAIVVSDMARAYEKLRAHRVRHASAGPQRLPDWNPAAGGIEAFYFKDPEGHVLEVISFPAGKGDPRWQRHEGRLFLGIDHTAIVVADTDRALALYRDALGMTIAGTSENWGIEQERLNNVFGARLRITTLRAASGPGIELLEYLAPDDGRPAPLDTRANDLWHWHVRVAIDDASALLAPVRRAGGRQVSPGEIDTSLLRLDLRAGALVRDADGHALLLAEPVGVAR
ncbi:MAG: glyoxalase [Acidobacteria bacterium]|nr:glyoxalase [Acidobacteriota bacterium]